MKDIGGEVLCVSQFTLMASTSKGSKPDFHRAMVCRVFTPGEIFMITILLAFQGSESSSELYSVFLGKMREAYTPEKIKGSSREVPCAFLLFVSVFSPGIHLSPSTIPAHAHERLLLLFCFLPDGKFGAMMNVSLTNEVRPWFCLNTFPLCFECLASST